jgi:hypothetical protein
LKIQPPLVVGNENDRLVMLKVPKNAVPIGTNVGIQLLLLLKFPVLGKLDQVESCARAASGSSAATATSAVVASSAAIRAFRHYSGGVLVITDSGRAVGDVAVP